MSDATFSPDLLDRLRALDTPTVCNALELVAPRRRGTGYTVEPLVCARPGLPPIVGYARTATIHAVQPSNVSAEETRTKRLHYYEYVAAEPRPTIAVIQDLDGSRAGYGAFWGEVNSAIHMGLGCVGCVTNGSMRDLNELAEGFQLLAGMVGPSHAYVHLVDVACPVNVHGMRVRSGDLIHADQHGAVVIPAEVADKVPDAAVLLQRREAVILEAARAPDFDFAKLARAMADADEIH